MSSIGPGSLKCIVGSSSNGRLAGALERVLRARVRPEDVRRLGDGFLVYTEASPSEVRDWLSEALEEGESAFVVEFERWSSRGGGVDREWLLRRGH